MEPDSSSNSSNYMSTSETDTDTTPFRGDTHGSSRAPYLKIIHQPQPNFRFRYNSEMGGTHGCLLAESKKKARVYPTVQLVNCGEPALLKCRLAQCDSSNEHPHKLQYGNQKTLIHEVGRKVQPDDPPVAFPDMGIIYVAQKDVIKELYAQHASENDSPEEQRKLKANCAQIVKKMNLNIVRLKFTAHRLGTNELLCDPVYSQPIHNLKSAETNELKICRMDRVSGSVKGMDEVFILTEKVQKGNIKVRFLELDQQDEVVWSREAHFAPADVHHQFAIVFRTPEYRDKTASRHVTVQVELYRPSDGRTSQRTPFKYLADPVHSGAKRKASSSSASSLSSGSLKSSDVPAILTSIAQQMKKISCDDQMSPMFTPNMVNVPTPMYVPSTPNYVEQFQLPQSGPVDLREALYLSEHRGDATLAPALRAEPPAAPGLLPSDLSLTELISQEHLFCSEEMRNALKSFNSNLFNEDPHCMDEQMESNKLDMLLAQFRPDRTDAPRYRSEPESILMDDEPKYQMGPAVVVDMVPGTEGQGQAEVKTEPYTAKYRKNDGAQVKKLVEQLVSNLQNKSHAQQTAAIVKQIMSYRLSNGDTFLHMLVANQSMSPLFYVLNTIGELQLRDLLALQNDEGETVLHSAVKYQLHDQIELMVRNGCDPMAEDNRGHTALHTAALHGDAVMMGNLLAVMADSRPHYNLDAVDNERMTPLLIAAKYGKGEVIEQLVSAGADVRARDGAGRWALHLACAGDHLHTARVLLRHMAPSETDHPDDSGNTALQIVCSGSLRENTLRLAELLCKHKANPLKSSGGNSCPLKLAYSEPQLLSVLAQYTHGVDVEVKSEPEDYRSAEDSCDEDSISRHA